MGVQPQAGPIKVLIADDNEKARDALIEQLRFEDVQVVGESTLGAAAFTWAAHLNVDVVLVAVGEPLARSLQTVESLSVGTRTWPVVAVSALGDRDTMRKAMVAGARDYVVAPANAMELRRTIVETHAVEQHRRAAAANGELTSRLGTVVAVFGVKGGIGKSTVATNVAVSLAQQTSQHVAMLDLDLQFGDAAVLLDLVPQTTIADAAKDIERMDPQLIVGYLAHHASRLRLLAAPPSPDAADGIGGDHVGQILEALAATNDYVVVDLGALFDQVSMVALDLATIVLIPVLPEVTCVRRTKAALTMMQQWGYTKDKIKLVVNRSRRRSEVTLAEIEQVLAYEIYARIPDDSAVGKANSLGTPVAMSGPKTKSGRAFLELGRQLAGVQAPPRRLFGLLPGNPKSVPPAVSRVATVAGATQAAAPAAPSLSSWARTETASPAAAPTPPAVSAALVPPLPPGFAPPNGHNPYVALNYDYLNALFGPREVQAPFWSQLVGPALPLVDGTPPGVILAQPAADVYASAPSVAPPQPVPPAAPAVAGVGPVVVGPNGSAD